MCGYPDRFTLPQNRGRGLPRPYRAIPYYNNVGRGDPTPPGKLATAAKSHGTVKTVSYKCPEGKQEWVESGFPAGL